MASERACCEGFVDAAVIAVVRLQPPAVPKESASSKCLYKRQTECLPHVATVGNVSHPRCAALTSTTPPSQGCPTCPRPTRPSTAGSRSVHCCPCGTRQDICSWLPEVQNEAVSPNRLRSCSCTGSYTAVPHCSRSKVRTGECDRRTSVSAARLTARFIRGAAAAAATDPAAATSRRRLGRRRPILRIPVLAGPAAPMRSRLGGAHTTSIGTRRSRRQSTLPLCPCLVNRPSGQTCCRSLLQPVFVNTRQSARNHTSSRSWPLSV